MKLLILALIALLSAVGLGLLTGNDSGYIVMTIAGWTVHTSVTFIIFLLFISFFALYFTIRTLVQIWSMPHEIEKWKRHRSNRRAEKYLTQGMINMVEGNWKCAEQSFRKAAPYSKAPFLNFLCAARAAQQQGNLERRDNYLRLAYESNPDANLAVGITQAELQLNQQQTEQALATLKHLHSKQPRQSQVKILLLNTYVNLNDWDAVLELITDLEKGGLFSQEQIMAKRLEAYAGLLREAGNYAVLESLEKVWRAIPNKLKKQLYLIEVYVMERLRFADTKDCEPLLKQALKHQWDEVIVRLYGLVEGNDSVKQLAYIESFLSSHARDPVLLLTLGRLCIRNSLWGKAKKYLEDSIEAKPNPEACQELAALLEKEGDQAAAAIYYQKGLALATTIAKHDLVNKIENDSVDEIICNGARQVV
jgi:HemY protein